MFSDSDEQRREYGVSAPWGGGGMRRIPGSHESFS